MPRGDPLNERQLLLLRRVANGDELSSLADAGVRTTAYALQSRGLIHTSKRHGTFKAVVTDRGQFYLSHGRYPDTPDPRPSVASVLSASTADEPCDLIERVQEQGGTLRIEDPDEQTRASYRRSIHAAKQHGHVPAGFSLRHTGRASGDMIIRLIDDAHPDETDWNRIRLNIRRHVTNPKALVSVLQGDPSSLDVSAGALPRALDIIDALAREAQKAGHRLGVSTKGRRPRLYLKIGQAERTITLDEESDKTPHTPTDEERKRIRRNPYSHGVPEFDSVPSGRLRLQLSHQGGWNGPGDTHWRDEKHSPLERKLRQVVEDVAARIAAEAAARAARARAEQAWKENWEREQTAKRAKWESAREAARAKAIEKLRKDTLRTAIDAWNTVRTIREFCDAIEHSMSQPFNGASDGDLSRWIAWARSTADEIDPALPSASLSRVPFDAEPKPDDLRPFMDGWSPHKPEHEYRSDERKAELAQIREQYTTPWHPGMLGRPTWWRHR
jgi:hypothetical protein